MQRHSFKSLMVSGQIISSRAMSAPVMYQSVCTNDEHKIDVVVGGEHKRGISEFGEEVAIVLRKIGRREHGARPIPEVLCIDCVA